MSTNKELEFLRGAVPEFEFIEGLEGGLYEQALAKDRPLEETLEAHRRWIAENRHWEYFQREPKLSAPRAKEPPTREQVLSRYAKLVAKGGAHVWQMPEGYGKSSIVKSLVDAGGKVVFCAKSNEQLVEQQASFAKRWPELRLTRYVSKGRNLQEQLLKLGVEFTPVYYESLSPYAAAAIDEPSTRQALRAALDAHGLHDIDHVKLFEHAYTTYKNPRIIGREVDVILCTLAALQGFCTSKYRPWWNALGLLAGRKRVFEEGDMPGEWQRNGEVPSDEEVAKRTERNRKLRTAEVGLPGVIVIIDDPDRTDFDFRRYVNDETAVELWHAKRKLPQYKANWRFSQHWLDLGYPPKLAEELARIEAEKAAAHAIESSATEYFEARPEAQHIGYGLQRGYAKGDGAPGIVVLTTEHITTKLAQATLAKQRLGEVMLSTYMRPEQHPRLMYVESPTKRCHVTLLSTKLVRRANQALLLLIAAKLREEFPAEDVTLIADALGCNLNLMNNRGRNDLASKSTIIKLSVPNPEVAINLWAQFPKGDARALNTILLADLANQAIGRNQGNRWLGKSCTVLIDPMYAERLVNSTLLRYASTPWSFHEPEASALQLHGPMTALERRLKHLLLPINAHKLGVSVEGFKLGVGLPDKQRALYEAWVDAHSGTDPGLLQRWEANQ